MLKFLKGKHFMPFMLKTLLYKELCGCKAILDIGCGRSSLIKEICKNSYVVGVDNYLPYLLQSKKLHFQDAQILADASHLPFKSKSFDCSTALEVIEHLKKREGIKLIREMERVTKKKIILSTPNGFWPAYAGPYDNPEEKHISGWTPEEFKKLGFKVYGLDGPNCMWKINEGRIVRRFRHLPPNLFQPIFYFRANAAHRLFCIKELGTD